MYKIQVLEKQSGILRLILFLYEKEEYMLSDIWPDADISVHQGYQALEKLKSIGIIKTRIDTSKYPNRNMVSLTDKGKRMAMKLMEIEELLES